MLFLDETILVGEDNSEIGHWYIFESGLKRYVVNRRSLEVIKDADVMVQLCKECKAALVLVQGNRVIKIRATQEQLRNTHSNAFEMIVERKILEFN